MADIERISTGKLIKCGIVFLFLALVIGVIVLYRRGNTELYQYVRKILENNYPQLRIGLARVQLVEMHGVRLNGITFSHPDGSLLFQVDEMYVECPITLKKALKGQIRPTRITLRYPVLYLQDRNKIKEQLLCLLPGDELNNDDIKVPLIIYDGQILLDSSKKIDLKEEISCLSGIQLEILPNVPTEEEGPDWTFKGRVSNPFVKNLIIKGEYWMDRHFWSFSGSVHDLEVGRELMEKIGCNNELVQNFQGRTSFNFLVKCDPKASLGFLLEVQGELFRGSGSLNFLKYPLSNLYVKYKISEKEIRIERMTARSGPIIILADYWQDGLLNSENGQIRLQLEEFLLDSVVIQQLAKFLPPNVYNVLDSYDFSMTAKINLVLKKVKGIWKAEQLGMVCRQIDGLWKPFPYRMEQLSGYIILDEKENLSFQFTSPKGENQEVHIEGHYANVQSDLSGQVEIIGKGHLLDNKLFRAIPPTFRKCLAELHPQGTIDSRLIVKKKANIDPLDSEFFINVRDAMVQYDRFPFPVSNINGLIQFKNGTWSFSNLQGKGRSALVNASGTLTSSGPTSADPASTDPASSNPVSAGPASADPASSNPVSAGPASADNELSLDHILNLQIDFEGFPLGEELENALIHFPQKELIDNLHLNGKANAQARIRYESKSNNFDLEFEARPISSITSIKPDIFSYELKNLDGLIVYRKGEIIIENLRAKNGTTVSQAGIRCLFSPDGSWSIDVLPFVADQVRLDRELQMAVPPTMLSFFDAMKVQGYFNITGAMHFSKKAGNHPLEAAWDMGLVLQQNSLGTRFPLNNICGKIQTRGIYADNQPIQIHGELDLDSLCISDIQLVRVKGPFYYDGKNIMFGKTVPHPSEMVLYLNEFLRKRLHSDPLFQQLTPPVQQESVPGFIRGQMNTYGKQPMRTEIDSSYKMTQKLSSNSLKPMDISSYNVGTSVPSNSDNNRRSVQGFFFKGITQFNGIINLNDHISYQMGIAVQDADIQEAIRDLSKGLPNYQGKVSLFANFQGESSNLATLKGEGNLVVRDAALYEMPMILKILQTLSIQQADQTAFNSGLVSFKAYGNRINMENVVLQGRALTVFGNGWLTLEENNSYIELKMNTRLGNSQQSIPVLSEVIGGAGDQLAQICIEGSLTDPAIWSDRFPGIKKAWWKFFSKDKTNTKNSNR